VSEFKKPSEDDIPTVIQREPPTPAQMEGPKVVEEAIPLEKLSVTPPVLKPVEPKQEIKVIDTAGPKPVEEMIPFDKLTVKPPVTKQPEPVQIKVIDTAGPKPVEEMIPFDKLTAPPPPPKPVVPLQEKIVEKVEPKAVEELIPFPPMPEKKVEVPVAVSSEPVKESVEAPIVKEEFPLPLPELKAVERKPIEMPMPEKKAVVVASSSAPQINPQASPNERMQFYLDILSTDPENIEARLNYINAFLEIGMEAELVDDYLELANCYHDQGNLTEARKYYEKVLELSPNILMAKKRLAVYKGELSPTTPIVTPQREATPPKIQNVTEPVTNPAQAIPFAGTSSEFEPKEEALITQFQTVDAN
jgi:hypothetical protein